MTTTTNIPPTVNELTAASPAAANVMTFGAVGDGSTNDIIAITAAIASLPSSGGTIYFPSGSYRINTTISLPDKSCVLDFAGGASISLGSNAISALTIPNTITGNRRYVVRGGRIFGNGSAAQNALRYSDSTGRSEITFVDPAIEEIIKPFDVTAYDTSQNYTGVIYTRGGYIFQPSTAGAYTLITAPNVAGVYAAPFALCIQDTCIDNLAISGLSWTLNADIDLVISGGKNSQLVLSGTNAVNGLAIDGIFGVSAGSAATLAVGGSGTLYCNNSLNNFVLLRIAMTLSSHLIHANGIKLSAGASIILNDDQIVVSNIQEHLKSLGAGPSVCIDVLAGADDCQVNGGFLTKATTALIRSAAQRLRVTGVRLAATTTEKTIADSGAGDYTLGVGCSGVSTGTGMTLASNSKVTVGDYNLA
jgi:hypothetical protein